MPGLRAFICHSWADKPAVRDLYRRLQNDGFAPWLDEEDLLPGQEWRKEIRRAVESADVVLVCLSRSSVTRQGFVHQEIGYALDVAAEQPEGTIFIIPVRLEECDVPERLETWHWVNLYEDRGYANLVRALRHREKSLKVDGGETRDPRARPVEEHHVHGRERRPVRNILEGPGAALPPLSATGAGDDDWLLDADDSSAESGEAPWEEGFGVALGTRLLWLSGNPFLVEAEISSYVDAPDELGVTLVFHSLDLPEPRELEGWRLDIDHVLQRDVAAPMREQFRSILRQLIQFPDDMLRDFLVQALQQVSA